MLWQIATTLLLEADIKQRAELWTKFVNIARVRASDRASVSSSPERHTHTLLTV